MTRTLGRFRGATSHRMRGGALVGFVAGLIVGLALAAFVAVYITRSPVPFVDRASRAPSPLAVPKSADETPDPNKPLYSKNRPQTDGAEAPAPAPAQPSGEERASILDRLFGKGAGESAGVVKRSPESVKGAPGGADARGSDARPPADARATDGRAPEPRADAKPAESRPADARPGEPAAQTSYLLQAGAFRSTEEAEAMKARLALLGLEARVLSAEVNGQTVYRVRVGPYAQLDEMNRARSRLAESGIEASVLRQR